MYNITNHALERYITRVLGLELNRDDYLNLMKEMGVNIIQTITDMLRDSDMIVTHDGSGYFLYRDIAFIVKGDCVVTIYEVYNEFDKFSDYTDYIKKNQEAIKALKEQHEQARFENDRDKRERTRYRIGQYIDLMFNNKLSVSDKGE